MTDDLSDLSMIIPLSLGIPYDGILPRNVMVPFRALSIGVYIYNKNNSKGDHEEIIGSMIYGFVVVILSRFIWKNGYSTI